MATVTQSFDAEVAAFNGSWPNMASDIKHGRTVGYGLTLICWFLYLILLELRKAK